jgi:putative membrane protein
MDSLSFLPSLNAGLNLITALFIVIGYFLIRQGAWTGHALCMILALLTSTLFLISYLYYHFHHGSTHFLGQGWIRPVYFVILISHTILAIVIVPMVITTFFWALRSRFQKHVRWARMTFPLWLYVSCTGVIIYWLLYHAYKAPL